ncbi:unnamed protein product [Coregonus sp. 'balchen']|nr:unnamed protein product [Coregonus sp. 'balchen']
MPADVSVSLSLLLATWHHTLMVVATPAAPVNVSITQLRSDSATITWSVPQGDTVIGYVISQQDNDYKDKPKRPSVRTEPSYYSTSVSAQSTPLYYNGRVQGSKNLLLFHHQSVTGPLPPLPSSECDRTSSSSSIIRRVTGPPPLPSSECDRTSSSSIISVTGPPPPPSSECDRTSSSSIIRVRQDLLLLHHQSVTGPPPPSASSECDRR